VRVAVLATAFAPAFWAVAFVGAAGLLLAAALLAAVLVGAAFFAVVEPARLDVVAAPVFVVARGPAALAALEDAARAVVSFGVAFAGLLLAVAPCAADLPPVGFAAEAVFFAAITPSVARAVNADKWGRQ
jgi:hypothetical protein